jgi:hypothetical protein
MKTYGSSAQNNGHQLPSEKQSKYDSFIELLHVIDVIFSRIRGKTTNIIEGLQF